MPMTDSYTLADVARKGWEASQVLKRKPHRPASLTALLDAIADKAVELHPAGNSREVSLSIFKTEPTFAAALAAIEGLE